MFSAHIGLFRYKRLYFGVCSAAEIFQNTIRSCLSGLKGAFNISDDILIHGENDNDHDKNLKDCIARLREENLTLNLDKCQFYQHSLEFYGHVFGPNGVSPDPKKVAAVEDAGAPKN